MILDDLTGDEAIIATTGKTGRELFTISDRPNHLYVVGGMGTASAIGFGVAHALPRQPVVVIDGDGAALMKMGSLATIGFYQPANLLHIILDNEAHDSTGGQQTASSGRAFRAGRRRRKLPLGLRRRSSRRHPRSRCACCGSVRDRRFCT